jgi:hypothetical protein
LTSVVVLAVPGVEAVAGDDSGAVAAGDCPGAAAPVVEAPLDAVELIAGVCALEFSLGADAQANPAAATQNKTRK